MRLRAVICSGALILTGCANQTPAAPGTPDATQGAPVATTPPPPSANTLVSFIGSGKLALADITTTQIDTTIVPWYPSSDPALLALGQRDAANNVAERCNPPASSPVGHLAALALLVPVVNWAIGQAVTAIGNEFNSELNKRLTLYKTTWTATGSTDFYAMMSQSAPDGFDTTAASATCFRYSRFEPVDPKKPAGPVQLASDFIGVIEFNPYDQIHGTGSSETITIKPVRLYYRSYDTIKSLSSDNKVAIKVDLSANATFIGPNQGQTVSNLLNGTLLTASIRKSDVPTGPIYLLYNDSVKGFDSPLPPFDYSPHHEIKDDHLTATITVTEVGDIPVALKDVSAIFSANKAGIQSSVTKDLQDEAANLDGSKSTPSTTSK